MLLLQQGGKAHSSLITRGSTEVVDMKLLFLPLSTRGMWLAPDGGRRRRRDEDRDEESGEEKRRSREEER